MAHVYSENHPVMKTGTDCNETFPGGITNGAYWYELNGECKFWFYLIILALGTKIISRYLLFYFFYTNTTYSG